MKKLMNIALESAEESSVSLDESMGDTLVDIVETGPLSKDEITDGLDELLEKKLVTMVASKGELRVAATPEGAKVYRRIVDPEDTLSDKTIDTIIYERVKLRNESSEGNPAIEGIFDTLKRAVGGGSSVSMSDIRDGQAAIKKIKATFLNPTWLQARPFKAKDVVIRKGYPTFVNNTPDFGYSQLKRGLSEFAKNAAARLKSIADSLAPFEKAINNGSMAGELATWSYRLDDAEIVTVVSNVDELVHGADPKAKAGASFPALSQEQVQKAAELAVKILSAATSENAGLKGQVQALQTKWSRQSNGLLRKLEQQVAQRYGPDDSEVEDAHRIISDIEQLVGEIEANLPTEDYLTNFEKVENDRFVDDLLNYAAGSVR